MKIFASQNSSITERYNSSSGGVFTILAEKIIDKEGIVFGAGFDSDWHVNHISVESHDNIAALRGCKYVYSDIQASISQAIQELDNGRKVLFSGTPCQVAAMHKRAGNNANLLLVEVICHGAPEPKYWDLYIDELCKNHNCVRYDIKSINFRDKRNGWKQYQFTIQFKNDKEISEFHGENIYMLAFLKNLTLKEGCFKCPFKYPSGSKADITLGDFWGVTKVAPEIDDDSGISLLIARTPNGESAIKDLKHIKKLTFEEACINNAAILHSPLKNTRKAEFERLLIKEGGGFMKAVKKYTAPSLKIHIIESLFKLKKSLLR